MNADSECGSCTACDGAKEEKPKKDALKGIKNKIVVLSGKGGVGKSTLAANLAVALSLAGKKTGLLDVDIHGPSVPRLLSLRGSLPHTEPGYTEPVAWNSNLMVMSLGFMLPGEGNAVIWRGSLKSAVIKQFLHEVAWGELDYLIVDCPPGTGDEPLTVLQSIGEDARAIIVTTPQAVAVDDVRRSIDFCREMNTQILGVIENMSGFVCPKCGEVVKIFSSGGGRSLADEFGVRLLGEIPLDPELVRSGDEGYAYVKVHEKSPVTAKIGEIIRRIEQACEK